MHHGLWYPSSDKDMANVTDGFRRMVKLLALVPNHAQRSRRRWSERFVRCSADQISKTCMLYSSRIIRDAPESAVVELVLKAFAMLKAKMSSQKVRRLRKIHLPAAFEKPELLHDPILYTYTSLE